jgi:hypothetical protein
MEKEHLSINELHDLIDNLSTENKEWWDHINSCEDCNRWYQSELAVHHRLKRIDFERPSMRFAKNIYDLIVKKQLLAKKELFWIRFINWAIMASILIVGICGLSILFGESELITIEDHELSTYFNWGMAVLLSIIVLWILYILDKWASGKIS